MTEQEKPVIFTTHALTRMRERGATEWDGRYYGVQQVVPIVAEEEARLVVVTVYTFFFQEGDRG